MKQHTLFHYICLLGSQGEDAELLFDVQLERLDTQLDRLVLGDHEKRLGDLFSEDGSESLR
jgi:hypothetical protein